MNLVWFRNDLRVADNPALSAACENKQKRVVAVYCICQEQWRLNGMGDNQAWLILQALAELKKSLEELNIPLVIVSPGRFDQVPEGLSAVCRQFGVRDLYFNMEYPVYERRRDKAVVEQLKESVTCHRKIGQSLVAPWEILNADGGGYKVFSAYARRVQVLLDQSPPINIPMPLSRHSDNMHITELDKSIKALPLIEPTSISSPDIRESSVVEKLERFCENQVVEYKDKRDFPAIKGTSELSSALAIGTISVVRCYHTAVQVGLSATATWVNELVWRDFYRSVMWNYPHVSRTQAFNPVDKAIVWSNNQEMLLQWQQGQTGIPIIDAAMNQLNQTGWMHNRLRMIVASYLTKNLFIDWREGEAYFARQLFDFDFASNNGGWQWSASVGTDAAPYFRVFNPAAQQKKFDPQAEFIKTWVPSLKDFSAQAIHKFESVQLAGYFQPQVDLKVSRKLAIAAFKEAKVA